MIILFAYDRSAVMDGVSIRVLEHAQRPVLIVPLTPLRTPLPRTLAW